MSINETSVGKALEEDNVANFQQLRNFEDMDLKVKLNQGINDYGMEQPSATEILAIRSILNGHDVIVNAHPTIVSIPILQKLDMSDRITQALILVPTREQAQDIEKGVLALGKHMKVVCHSSVGGTNIRQDVESVREGVHVLVGTVGRVTDVINRKALRTGTDNIRMICLYGADQLLSHSYRKALDRLIKLLPQNMQFTFLSVSMAADIVKTAKDISHDPSRFLTMGENPASITPIHVRQFYVAVQKEETKVDRLSDLLGAVTFNQAIILCNKRHQVDRLLELLQSRNITASAMHSKLAQLEREAVMDEFRSGSLRILISTDLHAQGINIREPYLVINFDTPYFEDYVRRITSVCPSGRKSIVVNFILNRDLSLIQDIKKFCKTEMVEMPSSFVDLI